MRLTFQVVRQIVPDSGSFTRRGASFTRALTNPQFLQQLLVGVQLNAAATFAACTTRSLRTHRTALCRETHNLPRLETMIKATPSYSKSEDKFQRQLNRPRSPYLVERVIPAAATQGDILHASGESEVFI